MNESQRIQSVVLELLEASKDVPRTYEWLSLEVRLAGYRDAGLRDTLEQMEDRGLITSGKDALSVRRWVITDAGLQQAATI